MATANLGFEEKLWKMADKLRGSMDSGEYKNVVLGLLFLKYVSDAFEEKYLELKEDEWADEEDRDEYAAENIFFVPQEARWSFIQANAKNPEIGQLIDKAMVAIEKENSSLVGVLPKAFARPELDKTRLGETIDLFSFKVGDEESREKDVIGRVYEYFLSNFASAEGKNGGEFYTPSSVVRLLVEMLEPRRLLDIIQNFILFQTDGENTFKILAAYHQYHAVNKAVEKAQVATAEDGDHKIGVVWHTQGSGKSLSMVFYAGKLIKAMNNPTLVVLTDRNDLDGQLYKIFSMSQDILRQSPSQAQSSDSLRELLNVESGASFLRHCKNSHLMKKQVRCHA